LAESVKMSEEGRMDNWKQFQGTELGGLMVRQTPKLDFIARYTFFIFQKIHITMILGADLWSKSPGY
jgi:hypothetical protein